MLETAIVEDRPRPLDGAAQADAARAREGVEQVVRCADCHAESTMTMAGRDAFQIRIRRPFLAVYLCPPCAEGTSE